MGRPRPRRRAGPAGDISRLLDAADSPEEHPDGDWMVRRVTGAGSTKPYRCPGCNQLVTPGTPHIVAWPAHAPLLGGEAVDARRHWHTTCWGRRLRSPRR